VWDYPRPPRLERVARRVRIVLGGVTIVDTGEALRVVETSHPPVYYVPRSAFAGAQLVDGERTTVCEYKGRASYVTLAAGGRTARDAAWTYVEPASPYAALAGHLAVYPGRVDACFLSEERVRPQGGDFYGGWVTDDVVGPFKGDPGTWGW
jgi:uncharacterized protein (DUF427 family)